MVSFAQFESRGERLVDPFRNNCRFLFSKDALQAAAETYRRKTVVRLHIPHHRTNKIVDSQFSRGVVEIRTRTLCHESITVTAGERDATILRMLSHETIELGCKRRNEDRKSTRLNSS